MVSDFMGINVDELILSVDRTKGEHNSLKKGLHVVRLCFVLCNVVLCCAVLYCAVLCYTMPLRVCRAVPCCVLLCCNVAYRSVPCHVAHNYIKYIIYNGTCILT